MPSEDFPNWRTVFRLIASLAGPEPLVFVLDEVQYLLGGDDDLPSQLVAVWDREMAGAPLTLILCGSEVSTVEALRGDERLTRTTWKYLPPASLFEDVTLIL